MSKQSETKTEKTRVVRVFVSSTFRDMHAEREELVKRVFPQLRKMCEQRGITWGEVDLRWGITDEQKAEGKVLPICLEEIKRCRPFFIGLLGERYGWVPDEIPQELIEQESWLVEHCEKSVTELEIIHGVLKNPSMANHACFYLRDPAYVNQVPANSKADFVEEDPRARKKLTALKDRIRTSSLAVRENYPNPQTLGQMVLEDLTVAINQEFPPEIVPDPLDREAAEHEAFARSRAGVYIGRKEYFDPLDSHVAGDGPPLVVLGESGVGKSALLANWALKYRKLHPDELVIMHFIGASAYSADWAAMLRRIMGEFKRHFGIKQDIPDKPDDLRSAFANWLHMAAARGRVVLILDALNQLEDRNGAPDLVWLPPVVPPSVRLIVSTLPGRPLKELQKRDWPTLQVNLLEAKERKQLIKEYLGRYRKTLGPDRVERIAGARQTANPLYLRALLEELRVFGEHEELDERIDRYLAATTVSELYEKIIERYEQDYERERPGLVKDAMSLIWASRRGLSETELLETLGEGGEPLPRACWSPLYLVAEQSLVSRSGLIGFFHDYLRGAVKAKYIPGEGEQKEAHLRLANYFGTQEIGPRKVDELPWQLAQAKSWQRLYNILADLPFFNAAWRMDKFQVMASWVRVEGNSDLHMVEAYQPVLAAPQAVGDISTLWLVATLLAETGHPSEAFPLWEFLVAHYKQAGDEERLQGSLGNQALILQDWGRLEEAIALLKQQEQICRQHINKDGLQASLGNQGVILKGWGRLEEAMALYKQQEQICRQLDNKQGLQTSLGNQALIFEDWGRLEEAMALHKQKEQICRELSNKDDLQRSLGNQALILRILGQLEEAMELLKQQEQICRNLGLKDALQASLCNQAVILQILGQLEEAMELLKQQEQICRQHDNKDGLQASLGNQGVILKDWGRLEEAMALHKQQEQICRQLDNKQGLQTSLGNQAIILKDWGRLEEAMALHKQQEQICRHLGKKDDLQRILGNQALILKAWGRLEEAMALLKQQEQICLDLPNEDDLQRILGSKAVILQILGRLEEAMELLKQQEHICRVLPNRHGLAICLGNQAVILQAWGRLEEAMVLYKQEEQICRGLRIIEGLARCLANQALLLDERMGEPQEVLALAEEAYRLATKHDLTSLAQQIKPILDFVRAKLR